MHVDIQHGPVHMEVQAYEGIPVLHHKGLIPVLDPPGNDPALYISSIDKIILIIAVASGDLRFPDKSGKMQRTFPPVHRQKPHGNIPSVDMIDHVFQAAVSRCLKFHLVMDENLKGNLRMRERQTGHQLMNSGRLRHLCL